MQAIADDRIRWSYLDCLDLPMQDTSKGDVLLVAYTCLFLAVWHIVHILLQKWSCNIMSLNIYFFPSHFSVDCHLQIFIKCSRRRKSPRSRFLLPQTSSIGFTLDLTGRMGSFLAFRHNGPASSTPTRGDASQLWTPQQ